jgi:hypothetical protein
MLTKDIQPGTDTFDEAHPALSKTQQFCLRASDVSDIGRDDTDSVSALTLDSGLVPADQKAPHSDAAAE